MNTDELGILANLVQAEITHTVSGIKRLNIIEKAGKACFNIWCSSKIIEFIEKYFKVYDLDLHFKSLPGSKRDYVSEFVDIAKLRKMEEINRLTDIVEDIHDELCKLSWGVIDVELFRNMEGKYVLRVYDSGYDSDKGVYKKLFKKKYNVKNYKRTKKGDKVTIEMIFDSINELELINVVYKLSK